jgi:acyl-CoA synthetase (AMP-forming)/AMP-acid ligase II
VRDACVLPHPQRPDSLAAAVAADLTVVELRTALHGRLASWKIPTRLLPLAEFPVTARGKTDLRALQSLLSRK